MLDKARYRRRPRIGYVASFRSYIDGLADATGMQNLREEMRRLQSSVQLLERQRNPGVGYWSASGSNANNRSDTPLDGRPSQDGPSKGGKESVLPSTPVARDVKSPAPSETAPRNEEEEVNLEVCF
jgi:hypothetical protein